ncbi:hypothetical protein HUU62_08805 [Rhodoferax sp. 4810]|uniref:Uncharacterized protein n=1 Tax=Thiospirillum jenense TaxID=1653858 RepID=A0A839HEB0_9GAMM|nr:hypothetical protein [Thiospirillum jenense]MBB1074509.1 hypothetical protein [Rhodoferax jenense]MBB1125507.1 hypothetical protein [Thiospirillum jenense]
MSISLMAYLTVLLISFTGGLIYLHYEMQRLDAILTRLERNKIFDAKDDFDLFN